jgi:hypothetical protein
VNLETLIAIEEIRQLNARYARYARYADARRWTDLADLFTPDGSFTSYAVDGSVVAEMIGRQAIEETLTKVAGGGDVVPIHLFLSHEIEPTGPDTAHSFYAMADLMYRGDGYVADTAAADLPPFRVMRGWGHYEATYVKTDDGWRYRTLTQTRTRLEFE